MVKNAFLSIATIISVSLSSCNHSGTRNDLTATESELYIVAKDSRDLAKFTYLTQVTLFKNGDTLKTGYPETLSNDLRLGKFAKGEYTLTYRNLFGQTISQDVVISGVETNTVTVYLDRIDNSI
jgi:hypothetical protein